ncbi:DUF4056 domain-containing protein [Vibrio rarus]|uniref:DUF4056 domain-containing protein n=1 Tax=Vibrio rarus TaxID=413403 RepID=UPI0021C4929D|nr:DUF4056 domain-containing protein [Vibrio rarus]
MKLSSLFVLALGLFANFSYALDAPSGVRPCCAFGINMKSELGVVPVPFFRVNNIVELSDLNTHLYNDGSQGVTSSLMGTGKESNGLIYTRLGGIIDTAHVRDTADYALYIYSKIKGQLGKAQQIVLEEELRSRIIEMMDVPVNLSDTQQHLAEIELSALLAFRLAQWHEAAQWFGYTSVAGFKEYPSAYSPEDLYSNMLGALIAIEILQQDATVTQGQYEHAFSAVFSRKLSELGAQDAKVTRAVMNSLDKTWWDSSKRLPNKWVVKVRDYQPRLTITPHWSDEEANKNNQVVTLSLKSLQPLEHYGYLTLVAAKQESSFSALPESITQLTVWRAEHFPALAEFAKQQDDTHKLSNNHLLPDY